MTGNRSLPANDNRLALRRGIRSDRRPSLPRRAFARVADAARAVDAFATDADAASRALGNLAPRAEAPLLDALAAFAAGLLLAYYFTGLLPWLIERIG